MLQPSDIPDLELFPTQASYVPKYGESFQQHMYVIICSESTLINIKPSLYPCMCFSYLQKVKQQHAGLLNIHTHITQLVCFLVQVACCFLMLETMHP